MPRIAGWTAAVALSVYTGLKLLWLAGIDVGVQTIGTTPRHAWIVDNAITAAIGLVGVLIALATVRPWGLRAPLWVVAVPMWVGAGLLAPFVVVIPIVGLLALFGWWSPPPAAADGSGLALDVWIFVVVYGSFVVGGVALVVALAGYALRRLAGLAGLVGGGGPGVTRGAQTPLAGLAIALGVWLVVARVGGAFAGDDALQRMIQVIGAVQVVAAVAGLVALLRGAGRRALVATWLGAGGLLGSGFLGMPSVLSGGETTWSGTTTFLTCVAGSLVSVVTLFALVERAQSACEGRVSLR